MTHVDSSPSVGLSTQKSWSEKRALMTLTITESVGGWHWLVEDKRWGKVAEGTCDTFDVARQVIEREWAYRRVLIAHGMIDELFEPSTKTWC